MDYRIFEVAYDQLCGPGKVIVGAESRQRVKSLLAEIVGSEFFSGAEKGPAFSGVRIKGIYGTGYKTDKEGIIHPIDFAERVRNKRKLFEYLMKNGSPAAVWYGEGPDSPGFKEACGRMFNLLKPRQTKAPRKRQ